MGDSISGTPAGIGTGVRASLRISASLANKMVSAPPVRSLDALSSAVAKVAPSGANSRHGKPWLDERERTVHKVGDGVRLAHHIAGFDEFQRDFLRGGLVDPARQRDALAHVAVAVGNLLQARLGLLQDLFHQRGGVMDALRGVGLPAQGFREQVDDRQRACVGLRRGDAALRARANLQREVAGVG